MLEADQHKLARDEATLNSDESSISLFKRSKNEKTIKIDKQNVKDDKMLINEDSFKKQNSTLNKNNLKVDQRKFRADNIKINKPFSQIFFITFFNFYNVFFETILALLGVCLRSNKSILN